VLRSKGYSLRAIGAAVGRSVSTISDELKRNAVAGSYTPAKAQAKATVRRKAAKFQGMTIVANRELQAFIEQELLKRQSPGAIAGRLATGLDGLPSVSRDTIERFIRSVHGRQLEYQLKVLKQKNRHRGKRPQAVAELAARTFIDDRPSVITDRERVGDVEADFIVSGKNGSGYLLTVVDRKIRYGFIRKLLPVSVANMEQAFLDVKACFPELESVTTDNDVLFRHHKRLEWLLGVPIYFCLPYHSWEKGTVENYNKQVRKYVPKGADISQYNEEYLQFVEARLNNRFMSILDYQTPTECLTAHRTGQTNETSRASGTLRECSD
jgi:transposase, IS30 family